MPIYEYRCKDCGTHIEKRQKVSADPLKVCEACGGTLEKQWSRTGFQFKGEGWYVTDYAGNKKSDASKSSEKSGGGESTGTADAASKPKTDGGSDTAKKD